MTGWSCEDKECYHDWKVTIAQEDTLIEQLRAELELEVTLDPFWDHEQLRRFLRARKHNILKAKTMVERTIAWRKENGIDTILEDFDFHEREQFHEQYPEGFFCTDKFGRPVYVQRPGEIDCDKLWEFTDLERSVKHHIQQQERYVKIIAPSAALKAGDRRAALGQRQCRVDVAVEREARERFLSRRRVVAHAPMVGRDRPLRGAKRRRGARIGRSRPRFGVFSVCPILCIQGIFKSMMMHLCHVDES